METIINFIVNKIFCKINFLSLMVMVMLATVDVVADEFYLSEDGYAIYKHDGYAYTFEGELHYSPQFQYAMPYPDVYRIFKITDANEELSINTDGVYIFRRRSYGQNDNMESYLRWNSIKNRDLGIVNLTIDSYYSIIDSYIDYMIDEINDYSGISDYVDVTSDIINVKYYEDLAKQYETCVKYLEEFKSRGNIHGIKIIKGCYEFIMLGDQTNLFPKFTEIYERFQIKPDMDVVNQLIMKYDPNNS